MVSDAVGEARMATFTWKGGSGNWTDSNWTISGSSAQLYPGAADVAIVDAPGTYTLTISGFGPSVHDLTLNAGGAEVDLATTLNVIGALTIDAGTFSLMLNNALLASTFTNDGTFLSAGLGAYSVDMLVSHGFINNGNMAIEGDQLNIATLTSGFTNAGVIAVSDFGKLTFSGGAFSNTSLFTLASGGSLQLDGLIGSSTNGDIQFLDGSASTLFLDGVTGLPTTVEDFQPGNVIDLTNTLSYDTTETATIQGQAIVVSDNGTVVLTLPETGTPSTDTVHVTNNGAGWAELTTTVQCFAAGTRIMTPCGEVEVEGLAVGDLVWTHLSGSVPVKWRGQRRIDCSRHPQPDLVWPVRIRAGAFADDVPSHDLWLSQDHAVFIDDVLIPIRRLINGSSIAQVEAAEVTYFHLALERHDILLAEGLLAESYLNTGNTSIFANGDVPLVLHPELIEASAQARREAGSCAPLATQADHVERLWQRLAERATTLCGAVPLPAAITDPQLRLSVAGRTIEPILATNHRSLFVLPRQTDKVQIISRAGAPSALRPWLDDRRRLGVSVSRITLRHGVGLTEVPVDHPLLTQGWHDVERDGRRLWRWTDGSAFLPVPEGTYMIELQLTGSTEYPSESIARTQDVAA
jgi:hypothetical protein